MATITGSLGAFTDSLDSTASQSKSLMAALDYLFGLQAVTKTASQDSFALYYPVDLTAADATKEWTLYDTNSSGETVQVGKASADLVESRTLKIKTLDIWAESTEDTAGTTAPTETHIQKTFYGSRRETSDFSTEKYSIERIVVDTDYLMHTGIKETSIGHIVYRYGLSEGSMRKITYADGANGIFTTVEGKYLYSDDILTSQKTTSFTYEDGTNKLTCAGTLYYDTSSDTLAGTISAISSYKNGTLVFSATGLSIDATNLQNDDSVTLSEEAFSSGNVTIDAGSDDNDNEITTGDGSDIITLGDGDNIVVTGSGKDTIKTGAGSDTIYAGDGSDKLTGGQGSDIFVFDTDLNAKSNVDTITDFVSYTADSDNSDTLDLSSSIFTNTTFVEVSKLSEAVDGEGLIYVSSSGKLYYDDDGAGDGEAAILFAKLVGKPELSANDFTFS